MKIIEVSTQSEVSSKQAEITAKVSAYQAAQAHQLQNGGPGPVADYDIMEIVNEHNGEFEVISKPEEIMEELQEVLQEELIE
jgi:hypothetical protein